MNLFYRWLSTFRYQIYPSLALDQLTLRILLIFRMAATAFQQATGSLLSHGYFTNYGFQLENGKQSLRLISNGFRVDIGIMRTGSYRYSGRKCIVAQASSSQFSVLNQASSPSNETTIDSSKKSSNMSSIISRSDFISLGVRITKFFEPMLHGLLKNSK